MFRRNRGDQEKVIDDFWIADMHLKSPLRDVQAIKVITNETNSKVVEDDVTAFEKLTGVRRSYWRADFHIGVAKCLRAYNELNPIESQEVSSMVKIMTDLLKPLGINEKKIKDANMFPPWIRKMRTFLFLMTAHVIHSAKLDSDKRYKSKCITEGSGIEGIIKTSTISERNELRVFSGQSSVWIQWKNHVFYGDRNALLMFSDVVVQRCLAFEICSTARSLRIMTYPPPDMIQYFLKIGDKLLEHGGSRAYKSIKMWEPLVMGKLQSLTKSKVLNKNAFYDRMKSEYLQELDKIGYKDDNWIEGLEKVDDDDHLAQLFCIFRYWGHPFVYPVKAIERNKLIAIPSKRVKTETKMKLKASFVKTFCLNFYAKKKRWPMLNEHGVPNGEIKSAYQDGRPVNLFDKDYDETHWFYFRARRNFDQGANLNILSIMSDKSCSPEKKDLVEALKEEKTAIWEKRKILAVWLKSNDTSAQEILKELDKSGLTVEDLLIGLTPKERELNEVPRLFSLMTPRLKYYFGLTEALIARDFVPLFQECTMTDSLQELMEKQINVTTKNKNNKRITTVFMSIDFEKWNMQFRDAQTFEIFRFMDECYGFKALISKTHEYFKKCRFYCADWILFPRILNNEFVDDELSHTGQQGGCEGLRQKGWTLVTIAALKMILDERHIEFNILGQGDNQVLALHIPNPDGVSAEFMEQYHIDKFNSTVEDIKSKIFNLFNELGMPIKSEETWLSTDVFSYGKYLIKGGRPLCTSLKKLSRMFYYANQDYPSLSTVLSSLGASAQSGIMTDRHLLVSFITACREAGRAIRHHYEHSLLLQETIPSLFSRVKEVTAGDGTKIRAAPEMSSNIMRKNADKYNDELFLFPYLLGCPTLGGTEFPTAYDCMVRGFPDPLSSNLTYLFDLRQSLKDPIKLKIVNNLINPVMSDKTDELMLFQDPLAINIKNVSKGENILKGITKEVLTSSYVKNKLVLTYGKRQKDDETPLKKFLKSMNPLNPLIASDILRSTPAGQCYELLGRFDSTRTIVKIARKSEIDLKEKMQEAERRMYFGWQQQWYNSGNHIVDICPSHYAQDLRIKSWGKITGVTIPHPKHLMKFECISSLICDTCTHMPERIEYLIDASVTQKENLFAKLGTNKPYLGSDTQERIGQAMAYEMRGVPSVIQACSSNMRMVGWFVNKASKLAELLRRILSIYSDIDSKYFETVGVEISGNWIHRYSDLTTKHGGFLNCSYTPATHLSVNTNKMGEYSKGNENYPLHFQALSVFLLHYLFLTVDQLENKSPLYHAHVACKRCLPILEANEVECAAELPNLNLDPVPGLWVSKEDILRDIRVNDLTFTKTSLEDLTLREKEIMAHQILAREAVNSVWTHCDQLPANWFFRCRIPLLGPRFLKEFSIRHLQTWLHRRKVPAITIEILNALDSESRKMLQCISADMFSGMSNLFMDKVITKQLPRNGLSAAVPPAFPTTKHGLNVAAKKIFSHDWETHNEKIYVAWGEMNPVQLFLFLCSAFASRGNPIDQQMAVTIKIISYKVLQESYDMDRPINIYGLINQSIFGFYNLKPHNELWLENFVDFLRTELVIVNAIIDSCIKSAARVELPPVDTPVLTETSCRLLSSACHPVQLLTDREHVEIDVDKELKMERDVVVSLFSSSHCLFLAQSLAYLRMRGIRFSRICVVGDGSGGTSMVADSVMTPRNIFVTLYFGEANTIPSFNSETPPDWIRFYGDKSPIILSHLWGDQTDPENQKRLSTIGFDLIIVDMDIVKEKPLKFVRDVLNNYNSTVLLLTPALEEFEELLSLCMSMRVINVLKCNVGRSARLHILCDIRAPKVVYTADKFWIKKIRFNDVVYDSLPIEVVEKCFINDFDLHMNSYAGDLDWINWSNEIEGQMDFCTQLGKYVKNVHVGTYSDDNNVRTVLGGGNAAYFFCVASLLHHCGSIEERVEKAEKGGWLVVGSSEHTPGHLCIKLWSANARRSRVNFLRKKYDAQGIKDFFIYRVIPSATGSYLWKLSLTLRSKRANGQLDHYECAGNCVKKDFRAPFDLDDLNDEVVSFC